MKMFKTTSAITSILTCLLLGACASTGVDVLRQTSVNYPPVDSSHVLVSSVRPSQKPCTLIAVLSAESGRNETPIAFAKRLQVEAAKLGADYLWLEEARNNTYTVPAKSVTHSSASAEVNNDPNGTGWPNRKKRKVEVDGYSTTTYIPSYTYQRTEVLAKAFKFTPEKAR